MSAEEREIEEKGKKEKKDGMRLGNGRGERKEEGGGAGQRK